MSSKRQRREPVRHSQADVAPEAMPHIDPVGGLVVAAVLLYFTWYRNLSREGGSEG